MYSINVYNELDDSSHFGWTVKRRYSEFFELHQQLKNKFGAVMHNYELPNRAFLYKKIIRNTHLYLIEN